MIRVGGRLGKLLKVALFLLRLGALAVLFFILAAGSAALVVKLMMPPEVLKNVIAGQLQEALRRPVQVQDVSVVLHQGLRVRGLRVFQAEGFPGGHFIQSDTLLAKYRWSSILGGRLEFTEIRLVSPRIHLVRREDGTWNVADMFAGREARPADAPLIPVDLAADVIAIDDGEMLVQDLAKGWSHVMRGFNLEVRGFDTQHPFPLQTSFDNETDFAGRRVKTHLEFKGQLDMAGLRWPEASVSAERLRAQVDGKLVDARVAVKDFVKPTALLDLKLPALSSQDLQRYASTAVPEGISVPATFWKARLLTPATGQLVLESLEGSGGSLKLSAQGWLALAEASAPWKVTAWASGLQLSKAAALWSGWARHEVQGVSSGTIVLTGDLRSDKLPVLARAAGSVKGLKGRFFKGLELQGMDGEFDGHNGLETMTGWAKGDFSVHGSPFKGLDVLMRIRKGDLELDKVDVTWGLSKAKLKAGIKNLQNPSEVRIDGALDKLNLDHLFRFIAHWTGQLKPEPGSIQRRGWSRVFKYAIPRRVPNLHGQVRIAEVVHSNFQTFNLDAHWDLTGISTGLKQAGGKFRVAFGPGRASDIPAIQDSHKILKVVFIPFVFMHKLNNMSVISAATAYPKTLDFTRIYGEYALGRGVVNVRLFHVDSGQLQAFARGNVDFPRELVDLHILTRLTQSRGPLPEYLTDVEGRPSIGFYVENNLNKPDLRLEYRKMEKDAIEKALEAGLKDNPNFFGD